MTATSTCTACFLLALARAADIARLQQRITDLTDQRDAARRIVEQQQTEHTAWRLEYGPRHPRGNR